MLLLLILFGTGLVAQECPWLLPVKTSDRADWQTIRLTSIGAFGRQRKERRGIPAHLHTGVDLARPGSNYTDEPIFPASCGRVISVRDDGPYGQIIVEHQDGATYLWTAYEHVVGIRVKPGDSVAPDRPLARFMTRRELNRFGWQFDHVHFEVLKLMPLPCAPSKRLPFYVFYTYNLRCHSEEDLSRAYFNPETFLKKKWLGRFISR